MKSTYKLFLLLVLAVAMTSCDRASFKKTRHGLVYKIISSNSKDSIAKVGDYLKVNYIEIRRRDKDSVMHTTYGRMPAYPRVSDDPNIKYNPAEIFPLLKKGDSAVVVLFIDTLISRGLQQQLPPYLKKGDRVELRFKVLDVFRDEAKYQADAEAESKKDEPNRLVDDKKRMKEQMDAQREMMRAQKPQM